MRELSLAEVAQFRACERRFPGPISMQKARIGNRRSGLSEASCPVTAALLRAPLLRFSAAGFLGLGEEVDLLGDDLAAIAGLAFAVGPA